MYLKVIPLIIVSLVNLFFSYVIFTRRHEKKHNLYYSSVVFFISTWSFGLGMFYLVSSDAHIEFWNNFLYLSGSLIPVFFLLFSLVFHTGRALSIKKILLLLSPSLIIGYLLFFTNTIIFSVSLSDRREILGTWYVIFFAHFYLYMLFAFLLLFRTRKKSDSITKAQLNYVIYGTMITTILAGASDIIMIMMGNFYLKHIGPYFTLVMVISFIYAMKKYKHKWGYFTRLKKESGFL